MINVTKTELPPLDKYIEYLQTIWSSSWITNDGPLLQLLEQRLQEHLRVNHLIAVANGTMALHCALKVLRLKGEVITTPFTFAATTNAILWENLTPVFADIDPETFNIDNLIVTMEAILIEGLEPPQNRKRGDDFSAVEFTQVEDPEIQKNRAYELIEKLKKNV